VQEEGDDTIKEASAAWTVGEEEVEPQASTGLELRGLEILKSLNKFLSKSCLSSLVKPHL